MTSVHRGAVAVSNKASAYEFARISDLSLVNDLYNQCYPHRLLDEARWFYEGNPWGPPLVWGVFTGGRLVGMRPAVPWRFFRPDRRWAAYQLFDALVAPEHRGKGLFRRLMAQAVTWASRERVALFSFPNDNSLAAYRATSSMQVLDHCESRIKVLSWMRFIRSRTMGAVALRRPSQDAASAECTDDGVTLRTIDRFVDDFPDVHGALARRVGRFTLRQSAFLNWRYVAAPGRRYHLVLVERTDSRAVGYIVIRVNNTVAQLVDVFIEPEPALLATVSRLLTHVARSLGASALCFRASTGNPMTPVLGTRGVLVKSDVQSIAVDQKSAATFMRVPGTACLARPYFVMGDCDVW